MLDLLFTALKLFSALLERQELPPGWLSVACDTICAACNASRVLLATYQLPGLPAAAAGGGGAASVTSQQDAAAAAAAKSDAAAAACGCAAAGDSGSIAGVVPLLVVQGRAVMLWQQLFKQYVQFAPTKQPAAPAAAATEQSAASASAAADGDDDGDALSQLVALVFGVPQQQESCLVGTPKALVLFATTYLHAVQPTLHVLEAVMRTAHGSLIESALQAEADKLLHQQLEQQAAQQFQQIEKKLSRARVAAHFGVPECVCNVKLAPVTTVSQFCSIGQQLGQHFSSSSSSSCMLDVKH